jgi:hypothetical protein
MYSKTATQADRSPGAKQMTSAMPQRQCAWLLAVVDGLLGLGPYSFSLMGYRVISI